MCEDMLRAGYQRFIVDPGVRQAYFPETARKLYTNQVRLYTVWQPVSNRACVMVWHTDHRIQGKAL